MSHATGLVRFKKDNKVMWYEYNGTSDVCVPTLYSTKEEMHDYWRLGNFKYCSCNTEHEDVEIFTTYGYGSSWDGKACRNCMCITQGCETDDYYEGIIVENLRHYNSDEECPQWVKYSLWKEENYDKESN